LVLRCFLGLSSGVAPSQQPAPAFIRSDNGPVVNAQPLRDLRETSIAYIAFGLKREYGFAVAFKGRFRDEFLNTELYARAPEARLLADRWRREYHTLSSYSALQICTPLEEAQQRATS